MSDINAGEVKARVTVSYDGSGIKQAREDLQSLADIVGGQLGDNIDEANSALSGLDEQMGKNAGSAKAFNDTIAPIAKTFEGNEEAVSSFNDALSEQQGIMEDTTKSLNDMQQPLTSYSENIQALSDTMESTHLTENMAAFQDALENPYPFQMIGQYLDETGQNWTDFTSSIGDENTAFLHEMAANADVTHQVFGGMTEDFQSAGQSFGAFSRDADPSAWSDAMHQAGLETWGFNDAATATNKTLNETSDAIGSVAKEAGTASEGFTLGGIGEAFGGVSEGLMGALSDIAMPLFAVQMIAATVEQVGQSIYDAAAIAEGPGAHSFGSFTGTVDALGQSAQKTWQQFSEGFGQGVLPTLNALNQSSQSGGGLGQLGGILGGITSTVANLFEVASPFGDPFLGLKGFANQGAQLFGLQQPFQGPGPAQQAFDVMSAVHQQITQVQDQTQTLFADATNPAYLAQQDQLSASQQAYQYAQQRYDIQHPVDIQQMLQNAAYTQYAAEQNQAYAEQMASNPTYMQMVGQNLSSGNFGGAWQAFTGAIGGGFGQEWASQGQAYNSIPDFLAAWGNNLWNGGNAPYQSPNPWKPGQTGTAMGGPGSGGIDWGGIWGGLGQDFTSAYNFFVHPSPYPAEPPESSTGTCFPAGTPILMHDGSEKLIETLQTGEQVRSHEGIAPIQALMQFPPKQTYALAFADGKILTLTDSHPIATTDGWKSLNPRATTIENPALDVSMLHIGDTVVTVDGTTTLAGVKASTYVPVFNLTVGASHTFYASGILVHNKALGQQLAQQTYNTEVPQADIRNSPLIQSLASNFTTADLSHTFTAQVNWAAEGLEQMFTGQASWQGQNLENQFLGAASWIGQGLENQFTGMASWMGQNLENQFTGAASWIGQGLEQMFTGQANWIGQGLQQEFTGAATWVGQGLEKMFTGQAAWIGNDLEHTFTAQANWIGQGLQQTFYAIASWIPGFASGVQGFGGGLAVVGEQGPELVELPSGSNVYPNGSFSGLSGVGGGGSDMAVVNVTHLIQLDSRIIAQQTIPQLAPIIRQQFGRRA